MDEQHAPVFATLDCHNCGQVYKKLFGPLVTAGASINCPVCGEQWQPFTERMKAKESEAKKHE